MSKPPLSEITTQTWARLIRVSQQLVSAVECDLKDAGLPPLSWYDALLELQAAGADGLRPFQLQESMLLAQYNLSRLVDRMVAHGLVARTHSVDDGRGFILLVTGEGRKKQAAMWKVYKRSISQHFAEKLSEKEMSALGKCLGKLRT